MGYAIIQNAKPEMNKSYRSRLTRPECYICGRRSENPQLPQLSHAQQSANRSARKARDCDERGMMTCSGWVHPDAPGVRVVEQLRLAGARVRRQPTVHHRAQLFRRLLLWGWHDGTQESRNVFSCHSLAVTRR